MYFGTEEKSEKKKCTEKDQTPNFEIAENFPTKFWDILCIKT